jgi:hypothetical protein
LGVKVGIAEVDTIVGTDFNIKTGIFLAIKVVEDNLLSVLGWQ